MTSQDIQNQALQLPLRERWDLVQSILESIQKETGSSLNSTADEVAFTNIEYRVGSSGEPNATIKNTRIRVQTLAIASEQWHWDTRQIAEEYGLPEDQVSEALRFYEVNRTEIKNKIAEEVAFEAANV